MMYVICIHSYIYIYNINIYKPSVYVETESIKLKNIFFKSKFSLFT